MAAPHCPGLGGQHGVEGQVALRIRRPEDVSPGEANQCGLGGLQREREDEPIDRDVRDVTRDIGDPTPEITEQVGEDGFGQREGLLAPRIVLDRDCRRALERRRDGLGKFASIRNVAHARGESWGTDLPRFHLRENVRRADEKLAEQIADAPAPFWQHVRDALAEPHP
jgi:hypothetical protein